MKGNKLLINEKKKTGSHYTPPALAEFVSLQILQNRPTERGSRIVILDPAVGDGELLLSLLSNLSLEQRIEVKVLGFDTDRRAVQVAAERLSTAFPEVRCDLKVENFLTIAYEYSNQGISHGTDFEPVDIVIANPPYVRTQILGTEFAQRISERFGLSGRVDLYYAFILAIASVLKPGGVAGIIVSNRFMTTKAGADVRENICKKFNILHVWDLGDTRLFEAAVLPAVLLVQLKNGQPGQMEPKFTSVYSTAQAINRITSSSSVVSLLNEDGAVQLEDGRRYLVRQGILGYGDNPREVWRLTNDTSKEWLDTVEKHTYCTFGEIGKVRVGVKTTADRVFIRDDWHELPIDTQPELLQPLITHHIARRFKAAQSKRPMQILYTHIISNGKRLPVNLSDYPRSAQYLNSHRSALEGRSYISKAGRQWFEIWVPQDPRAWKQLKLVFRDITDRPVFWLDNTGAVVNGDCYWMIADSTNNSDLLWLALAVGNSSFIETFYDRRFNNKLYAGRRRFMTQYVEKFPLPEPESEVGQEIIDAVKTIFEATPSSEAEKLEVVLDGLVWKAFGVF